MKLYYHKTDGGAEYLMDTFISWKHKGKSGKEGTITDKTKYIIRIDGNIEKDCELNIRENKQGWNECNHYVTDQKGLCVRCRYNTLSLSNKKLSIKKPILKKKKKLLKTQ